MKKIYNLSMRMMNGTVTVATDITSFDSYELAVKVKEKLMEVNKNSDNKVIYGIYESTLYTDESEVPILNDKENK